MSHARDLVQRRVLAEQVVRHVAAGTGFTTIVTIGMAADGAPVWRLASFSATRLDASYGHLLDVATGAQRRDPIGEPAYACALVLPEYDIAYLHHREANAAAAQVLVVGRNPVNDPDTHAQASHGLAALLQAMQEAPRPSPAAGRAFGNHTGSPPTSLPVAPPDRPRGYHGRHR